MAEVAMESKIGRLFLEMPLPGHRREIPGFAQHFGGCHGMREGGISGGDTILPGEQGNPREEWHFAVL